MEELNKMIFELQQENQRMEKLIATQRKLIELQEQTVKGLEQGIEILHTFYSTSWRGAIKKFILNKILTKKQ